MKLNKIFSIFAFLFVLALAVNLASATVTVNYNVSSAIIEDDASLNTTGSALLNGVTVDVEGYSCTNAACTTTNPTAIPGLVSTTSNGVMTVVYPNNMPNAYGYVLYFHADGYIGWEQFADWNSPDLNNYNVNSSAIIYLSKKRSGYAPIMNLTAEETVPTNRPIEVSTTVSIDADTYAAIEDVSTSDVPLDEEVETLVTLEIINSTGSIIYTDDQTVNIPYSGSADVNFVYAGFSQTGDYNIRLSTNVTDAKILNSSIQSTELDLTVIPAGLLNYSYSEISAITYIPALPRENDTVNFAFDYFSIFVNETGGEEPINTTLNITITQDGDVIYNNVFNASTNGSYNFSRTFTEAGNYLVNVIGTPTNPQGNQTILQSGSVTFTIGEAIDDGDDDDDDDDDDDSDDELLEDEEDPIYLRSASESAKNITSGAIDLTHEKTMSLRAKIIWALVILILILLIAIAVVGVVKFGVLG